jgi:hypothetical protein
VADTKQARNTENAERKRGSSLPFSWFFILFYISYAATAQKPGRIS